MNKKWDRYFFNLCETVASQSACLSREIGCVITRDNRIVATGYNGPASGISHCGEPGTPCPRRLKGIPSGDPRLCVAVHAEMNAIITAARNGTSTLWGTLWLNNVIPCKNCFSSILNAGITSIVVLKMEYYDKETERLHLESNLWVREFDL
jgi:dCMP deaminase